MNKHHQHSDYANTDPDGVVPIRGGGLMLEYETDANGHAVNLVVRCATDGDSAEFMAHMRRDRHKYPLAWEDIVLPEPDWPFDADGRGLTVQEVKGNAYLATEWAQIEAAARPRTRDALARRAA